MSEPTGIARTPDEVAVRATLCMALAMRGLVEDDAGGEDEAEANTMREQLLVGLQREPRLWDALLDEERKLLETPVGSASPAAADGAIWEAEAGQVLLWTLERRDLPSHDEQEHPFKVAKSVGVISNVGGIPSNWLLLRSPRLRSVAEIRAQQRRLTAIGARLQAYARDPEVSIDYREFAGEGSLTDVAMRAGDLSIEDEPILIAEPGAIANALAVATQRQRGIDWVVGESLEP